MRVKLDFWPEKRDEPLKVPHSKKRDRVNRPDALSNRAGLALLLCQA